MSHVRVDRGDRPGTTSMLQLLRHRPTRTARSGGSAWSRTSKNAHAARCAGEAAITSDVGHQTRCEFAGLGHGAPFRGRSV
jgi:hypothetical protein